MMAKDLNRFFWDVDPDSLDLGRHKAYIIERILEFGDERAIRWLFTSYPRDEIVTVLSASRSLSPKSRKFWRLRLDESVHV